jgi:hypothetical protein
VAISDSATGVNIAGQRRAIADVTGAIRATLFVRAASGFNTAPTLTVGMTQADAEAAIVAAGFIKGTVTQTTVAGAAGVSSQVQTGKLAVRTAIDFTVNTPPPPA